MLSSRDSNPPTKEPLVTSLREAYFCTLESCHGGRTYQPSRASRLAYTVQRSRTPQGLADLCIYLVQLLVGAVFVFTLLTSWGTETLGSSPNSMGASRWENESDGSEDRKGYCSANLLLEGVRRILEEEYLNWRYDLRKVNPICHSADGCLREDIWGS